MISVLVQMKTFMHWAQWLVNKIYVIVVTKILHIKYFQHNCKGMGLSYLRHIFLYIYINWIDLHGEKLCIYSNPKGNTFIKPIITSECIFILSLHLHTYWFFKLRHFGGSFNNVIDSQYSSIIANTLVTEWTVLIFIQITDCFTSWEWSNISL